MLITKQKLSILLSTANESFDNKYPCGSNVTTLVHFTLPPTLDLLNVAVKNVSVQNVVLNFMKITDS